MGLLNPKTKKTVRYGAFNFDLKCRLSSFSAISFFLLT
jgi:hypothetical protein